jgi:UDP-N-acetyl-D-glucosamine dehydrogenase
VGLAYKPNSGDTRNSPSMSVAKRLKALGAQLCAVDPLIDPAEVPADVEMVPCDPRRIAGADLVIILTDHDAIDWELLEQHAKRVLDTRNRLHAAEVERL